jgi:hypothetical protein
VLAGKVEKFDRLDKDHRRFVLQAGAPCYLRAIPPSQGMDVEL